MLVNLSCPKIHISPTLCTFPPAYLSRRLLFSQLVITGIGLSREERRQIQQMVLWTKAAHCSTPFPPHLSCLIVGSCLLSTVPTWPSLPLSPPQLLLSSAAMRLLSFLRLPRGPLRLKTRLLSRTLKLTSLLGTSWNTPSALTHRPSLPDTSAR